MQKDTFALFVNNSGPVEGSVSYWSSVDFIFHQYAKDISHCYLWNSNCSLSSQKEMEAIIKAKKGTGETGGASPKDVATTMVKKKFKKVILVTDGMVGDYSVQACDKIFEAALNKQNFKLSKSLCYIIPTGSQKVNMSVTCPFTRYCEHQVFAWRKGEALKAIVQYTAEDYKILDTLDKITLQKFEAKYNLIEGLIIALNMGKEGNIPLKNQLVTMKHRLIKQLSKSMTKETNYGQQIRASLENKDFNTAIEVANVMCKKYFSDGMTTDLEKKISQLIILCGDLRGKYSIGQIKSYIMAITQNKVEGKIDKYVEVNDLSKDPIECPIIMDEDVPQILIDECEPILLDIQKNIVDDIATCPLRILNYPEIKAKFKSRLSTFTGVKYSDKMLKNPFTQNRLLGAIPLGNHHSHVTVANYTIAKMVAGGKIMGNLNMYYAVIWYLINEGEAEYLNPIKNNATQHLVYRLRNSKTMASICGLAQFVTTQVPTDVAVWYCVSSGYLNQPTDRDTFRLHLPNLEPMIKMVKALGYPLHEGLKAHFIRTKTLMTMLSKFKNFKKFNTQEKKQFQAWCKGFYQRGFFIDASKVSAKFKELQVCSSFIPIDGEPEPNQINIIKEKFPHFSEQLPAEELYHISTLLVAQKSASDIFLDYNLKVPPLPKAEVNWCYGLQKSFNEDQQFCPKTLRPFYIVKGRVWQDVAKECFKVTSVTQLFSGYKYLTEYILKYQRTPEIAELTLFYYNRYVEAGKKNTLPYLTKEWCEDIYVKFSKASEGYPIEKIIKIINLSRPKDARMLVEK